jgi:hypothetical protein
MEEENEYDAKKKSKMTRNKISILIIGFYAGLCVISDLAVKYYFKDKKKVETANLTRILIIFKIPYLIKPIYGLILDFIPICGYKKKSYLFICFLVNISSWYLFIISNEKNMLFSIICLLFVNISLSFTTVIGSAIQVDLSKMYENEKSNIGEKTSQLMSEYFIIKSLGTLIPSYFKGFLIAKYSNDIIFYISGIISFLILISDIILVEEKNIEKNEERVSSSSLLDNEEKEKEKNNNKKENTTQQILNLIKNKNIIILLSLIFILESSPFCMSPLFYYETNFLNLNPQDLGNIDFLTQISIIVVIYIYKNLCFKYNFKAITFFVRICQFTLFFLIYMLIMRNTQKYISDLYLVTITITLREGFTSLGRLPYSLLAIQFSPLNLEATTYSLCVFSCYLGNIFADYIDYFLAVYFQITHYNFVNLGILVLVENIINLIPLFYTLAIPNKFFFKNKENLPETSSRELITLEDKKPNKKNK